MAGVITAALASVVGGEVRAPLLVLAIFLPFLFIQDACRYVFFSEARMRAAALLDGVWLILELLGLGVLLSYDAVTPATAIAAWGGAAGVGAVIGLSGVRVRLTLRGSREWLHMHPDLTLRYVAEVLVEASAFQITLFAVGVVGGLAALGALNGARVLLGPLTMLFVAAVTFTVSEGSRMRANGRARSADRLIRIAGLLLPALALAWTFTLLVLPDAFGELFLGATFKVAESSTLGHGALLGYPRQHKHRTRWAETHRHVRHQPENDDRSIATGDFRWSGRSCDRWCPRSCRWAGFEQRTCRGVLVDPSPSAKWITSWRSPCLHVGGREIHPAGHQTTLPPASQRPMLPASCLRLHLLVIPPADELARAVELVFLKQEGVWRVRREGARWGRLLQVGPASHC